MSAAVFDYSLLDRTSIEPGKYVSLALAIGMHVILALFLFYGVRWQTHTPEAVQVELVRAMPQPMAAPPSVEPPPVREIEPPPKPEPKPIQKIEPKPEPKAPPKPAIKPDIAVKEKVKPEPKPEPKPEVKPNKFDDMLKKETQQRERNKITEALDQSLAEVKAEQASAARGKAIDTWIGRIRDKIRGNITLPPDVRGNPEAVFMVTQLPTGQIIGASLSKSSGNAALDAAIERAILISSPLPKPDKNDLFERELKLSFRPMEN